MVKFYLTKNPSETKKLGEKTAMRIRSGEFLEKRKQAIVLALEGDLGGGKTTFLQGFARGLGIKEKILSPTFIIMKKFQIRSNSLSNSLKFASFYHFDCYRIKKSKEILNLGFKEIITNPKNIVAIEWAEKIKKIIPKKTLWMSFHFLSKKTRKITFKPSY